MRCFQGRCDPLDLVGQASGDVVRIETPAPGALVNRLTPSDKAAPWTFGVAALMRNRVGRGLLRVGYLQQINE